MTGRHRVAGGALRHRRDLRRRLGPRQWCCRAGLRRRGRHRQGSRLPHQSFQPVRHQAGPLGQEAQVLAQRLRAHQRGRQGAVGLLRAAPHAFQHPLRLPRGLAQLGRAAFQRRPFAAQGGQPPVQPPDEGNGEAEQHHHDTLESPFDRVHRQALTPSSRHRRRRGGARAPPAPPAGSPAARAAPRRAARRRSAAAPAPRARR